MTHHQVYLPLLANKKVGIVTNPTGIVENKKHEEVLKKWLQTKIKSTYVRIDKDWENCDFQYPDWIKKDQASK